MSRERRSFPRYPVKLQVQVQVPGDNGSWAGFTATASTLSRTSIAIACGAELIAALLRQAQLPYGCRLQYSLAGQADAFDLPAQVITHRRLSQHQYVLVLLFLHKDEEQEQRLDNWLQTQQQVGLD